MERETPEEERRSMMELITGTELAGWVDVIKPYHISFSIWSMRRRIYITDD
jgi:hypothetical protein